MTEVTERAVQDAIVVLLRRADWLVVETSQPRRVLGGIAGLPDLLAFRDGVTVCIEVKAPGRMLRESQVRFRDAILPHLGPQLHYLVAYCIDDVKMWA